MEKLKIVSWRFVLDVEVCEPGNIYAWALPRWKMRPLKSTLENHKQNINKKIRVLNGFCQRAGGVTWKAVYLLNKVLVVDITIASQGLFFKRSLVDRPPCYYNWLCYFVTFHTFQTYFWSNNFTSHYSNYFLFKLFFIKRSGKREVFKFLNKWLW